MLPSRKHPRLKSHDYGPGCYHLTVCTKYRKPFLSRILQAKDPFSRPEVALLPAGMIVDRCIRKIPDVYSGVRLLKYVIMPNHIHLLLQICDGSAASVPTIIRSLKRVTHKEYGSPCWQDSFYDVIIRNDTMYRCEWEYIDTNPDKWADDELYIPDES